MNRNIETFHIDWNSIAIEIRWEPHWLGVDIGTRAPSDHRNRIPFLVHVAGQRCRLWRPRRLRRSMARNREPGSRLATRGTATPAVHAVLGVR